MMFKKAGFFILVLSLFTLLDSQSTKAQEIITDGNTATIVTKNGDRITIDGNTLSRDGKNLFHSFKEFGLTQQQIATFLTNPNIQNILTRVTGGNPSYIQGLIQVIGGNSNLFLMNPAGIVFGQGASINVPTDFTATTATGIGFNNGVFSAVGSNDYQNLTGNPTNFIFNTNQPGSIINSGDLKVSEGSNINLIGGNVINTGTIETPQGKINIQAVKGTSRVKITPEGSLLSLEFEIPQDEKGNLLGFTPQDLPTLLTGANNAGVATSNVTTNNNQVQVANVNVPEGTGNSIVSGNISTSSESLGGEITVLGERVGVIDGKISANGENGGGKVLIGGDFQGKGTIPNAQTTIVNKNSTIIANATKNGDGGQVIVWADGNTSFTGSIEAKGGENSGDGGFVEVSGKNSLYFKGQVDTTAENGTMGTLLLDPTDVTIQGGGGNDSGSIIFEDNLEALPGTTNVIIEATNNITIEDLSDNALTFQSNITTGTNPRSSVTFNADSDNIGGGDFSMDASDKIIAPGRDINISGNNITVGSIDTSVVTGINGNGGDITLSALNNITIQGTTIDSLGNTYSLGSYVSKGGTGNAGNINLISANGLIKITPDNGNIIATTDSGNAGNITLNTGNGSINLPSNIQFRSFSNDNNTGKVSLTGNSINPSGINSTLDFVVRNQVDINTINLNVTINNTDNNVNPIINVNSSNDVNINNNINTNGDNLNINANANIFVNNGVAITTAGGNVVFQADADNNQSGAIQLNSDSSIDTSNGNIILGGSIDTLGNINYAYGNFSINSGVEIDSATLNSGNGNILIKGIGLDGILDSVAGIDIFGKTSIISNDGNITLDGIARASGNGNYGIALGSNDTILIESTGLGNINLQGKHIGKGISGLGIATFGSDSLLTGTIKTNNGSITLTGETNGLDNVNFASYGIGISPGVTITSTGGKNINLNGFSENNSNGIAILGNINNSGTTIFNTGNDDIFISDNSASDFGTVEIINARNVDLVDINALNLGTSNLTGDLTISNKGQITDSGNVVVTDRTTLNTNNNIILDSSGNNFNNVSANGVNITLNDSNAIELGNINATNLNVTTQGEITDNGNLVVSNTTQLDSNNNNITLDNSNHNLNKVSVNGSNVLLDNNIGIILGTSNATGDLTVSTQGEIIDDGNIIVGKTAIFDSNNSNIILDNDGNNFNTVSADGATITLNDSSGIDLGTINATNLNVTTKGDITNSGGVVVTTNTVLDSSNNKITLDNSGNDFNTISANGSDISLNDSNAIDLVTINASNLNVTTQGEITDSGNLLVTGTTKLESNNNNISLDNSGNDFNTVSANGNDVILNDSNSIDLGAINTDNLNVTTKGDITNSGGVIVTTNTVLDSSHNKITLDNSGNDFNTVSANGSDISLNDSNAIDLVTINASNLNVTTQGEITDSGNLIVTGTTKLESNNNNISLDNSGNDFNTVSANGSDVILNDSNGIDLGTSNVTGNLTVTSQGDISNSGSVAILGTTTLNSNNNKITLDNSGNDFNTVSANGSDISLNDSNAIDLVTINASNLNVTTQGEITDSGNLIVTGTTKLESNNNNISLDNSGNDFNTVSANGSDVILNDSNGIDLGTSNVTGNLTVTSQGDISNSGSVVILGTTTLNSNNNKITLDNSGNDFNTIFANGNDITLNDANGINLGTINTNNLNVTTKGDITNSGGIVITENTVLNSGNNQITLDNSGNNFNTVSANGGDIALNDSNAIDLVNINASNLNVTTQGEITDSGNLIVSNTTKLDSNNNNVTLDNSGNDFNLVSVENSNNITLADVNDLSFGSLDSEGNPTNTILSGDLDFRVTGNTLINTNIQANNVSTDSSGSTTFNGDTIITTGNQTYNDAVILTKDTTIQGNNINFYGSIDSQTNPQNLTVTAVNNINYGDGSGDDRIGANVGLKELNSEASKIFLNINREGLSPENASIRTLENQNYKVVSGDTLYLAQDTVIDTLNFNLDGNIRIANSAVNGVDLTIKAIENVSITTPVDIPDSINTAKGNNGGDITIRAGGNIDINGIITTSGLNSNSFVTEGGSVILESTNKNGFISVGSIGTIGIQKSGIVNLIAKNILVSTILTEFKQQNISIGSGGTINITADNTLVLGTIQGESLTVNGNLLLTNFKASNIPIPSTIPPEYQQLLSNSAIITSLDQEYNGQVFLDDNTTFSGANIRFNGGVDSFDLNPPPNILQLSPNEITTLIVDSVNTENRSNATPSSLTIMGGKINLGDGINDDRLGSVAGLASLNVTGETTININTGEGENSINTTGDQTFNGNVIISADTVLNGNNITFGDTLSGNNNLTVNSNNDGITTFNTVTDLNNLTTNSDGKTVLTANISTNQDQVYNDAVILAEDVQLTGNNITFNNSIDSQANPQNLTVTATNTIKYGDGNGDDRLGGNIGLNNLTSQAVDIFLNINREGLSSNDASIRTIGNQDYTVVSGDTLYLANNTVIDTNDFNLDGNIRIADSAVNGVDLTINAQGDVSITTNTLKTNIVDSINTAKGTTGGNVTISANGNIDIDGIVNTGIVNETKLTSVAQGGNVSLSSSNGLVAVSGITTLGTQKSGAVNITGQNILIGTVVSSFSQNGLSFGSGGTINLNAPNTLVLGSIFGESLTIAGNLLSSNFKALGVEIPASIPPSYRSLFENSTITTVLDQTYNGNVLLDDNTLFNARNIIFKGGIDSFDLNPDVINLPPSEIPTAILSNVQNRQNATPSNLTIVGNTVNFGDSTGDDRLGSVAGINNLTVTGTTNININTPTGQNSINTKGNQTFNSVVTLANNTTLNGNNITFNENVTGNGNLTVNSNNNGVTTFNSDVMGLNSLTTNNDGTTRLNGNVTTTNNQNYQDQVLFDNNLTLTSNNGSIEFGQSINSNKDLTLNATKGNVLIDGNIGDSQRLNNLTITTNNTTINGTVVNTVNNQTFNSNLSIANNTTFNTSQGSFTSGNIVSNGKSVTINGNGNINTQNMTTAGGNITLNGNAVTTQNLNTSSNKGGTITVTSNTTINTGNINSTGSNGNGGNVTLTSKGKGDIEVSSIDTSSNNGSGGNVNIATLGRVRVTDTIDGTDISIDARGSNGGGDITINLFPDNSQKGKTSDSRLPFVVGDTTSNGTQGIITNGTFSIAPDQYFEVVEEGNINVVLLDPTTQSPVDPRQEKLNELKQNGDTDNAVSTVTETPQVTLNLASPVLTVATITEAQEILTTIEKEAAEKPAFIYVSFTPRGYQPQNLQDEFVRREATNTQEYSQININKPNMQPTIGLKPSPDDLLDLLIITNKGEPVRIVVPVTRQQVVESSNQLWSNIADVFALNEDYKPFATDLYSWLIAPMEDKLKEREISNLLFILPTEIRFIPIPALYDANSQQFLVEKYSSGLAPSLNLNDNRYRPLKDANLLAMGASQFAETGVTPLPAVGVELPTIKKVWNDETPEEYQRYLNENFTLEQIKANLAQKPYQIVHFGTHGEFNPTETTESFIQLYNSRLPLGEIDTLGLNEPLVELMVLSACETAFGNEIAELGFAGLAVKAGVKTAMGSVWQVSDTGTLALMTDFYAQLKTQTTKAEALRQAQLDMLNGKVYKSPDGNTIITPALEVSLEGLPENSRQPEDFSHPFYWAPFTMIGNPW